MSRIGQRLSATAPRYLKHPAASSSWVQDARFVDAGSVQHFDSNLGHLVAEGARPLAHSIGPGVLEVQQNGTWWVPVVLPDRSYFDVEYVDPATVGLTPIRAESFIAWDSRTSMDFGPFVAIQDRRLETGGYGPRKIRVCVHTRTAVGASLYIVCALTESPAPPSEGSLVIATAAGTIEDIDPVAAPATTIHVIDLEAPREIPLSAVWASRESGARGSITTAVAEFYVWVGYYCHAGTASVIAASAFELPPE